MSLSPFSFNPLFSVYSLTAALNRLPYTPGLIGSLNLFRPEPLTTATAVFDVQDDSLALVPSRPRGAPAAVLVEGGRSQVPIIVPHFPYDSTVMADAILGVRAFGTTNQLESMNEVVQSRLARMGTRLDVTLEWLRLGAVKGQIITHVNRDTGAPLDVVDLFAVFGVTKPPVQNWPILAPAGGWTEAHAWKGTVLGLSETMAGAIADEMGGLPTSGIYAVCGSTFFRAIISSPEVRQTYLNYTAAATLREATYGARFSYHGVTYIEYIGKVGNLVFVAPDEAHFFPGPSPDLWVECYAPADYIETVNTLALPRYSKQEIMDFDKGIMIEAQMNVLPVNTRPRTLVTAKAVAAT